MNFKKLLFSLLPLLFVLSCSDLHNLNQSEDTSKNKPLLKVVNTDIDADRESILIKLKSSSANIDLESLNEYGVTSYEPVFSPNHPNKEKLAQYGLDSWYLLKLEKTASLDMLVQKLDGVDAIRYIQYNKRAKKASDCIVEPYRPLLETKSETKSGTTPNYQFNDPLLRDQWHYYNNGTVVPEAVAGADANVLEAWKLTAGDPSIIVAVVDEGVAYNHPDLEANMWVNTAEKNGTPDFDDDGNGYDDDVYGYNFVRDTAEISFNDPKDAGHGTHVAGTVAAVNNNNRGVAGIAGGSGKGDGVKIMSCQIFDGSGGGTSASTANAIVYAADNGASILQGSFGYAAGIIQNDGVFKQYFTLEYNAIEYFINTKNNDVLDGGLCIFAAGNDGKGMSGYPAGYSNVISVSSIGADHRPTYYTNYGPGCNISAIGGEWGTGGIKRINSTVLSTVPFTKSDTGYGYMQGTSMACPLVSGIAALGLSYAKKLGKTYTVDEFRSLLLTAVNDINPYLAGSKIILVQKPDYSFEQRTLELTPFIDKMGTGLIDAWQLLMKLEGTPYIITEMGRSQWLNLSDYFGEGYAKLTYLEVSISPEDKEALGLAADPELKYQKVFIHPTKVGSGKLKVRAIAGGANLGTDDTMGGLPITMEIAVVARSFKSKNGGWL